MKYPLKKIIEQGIDSYIPTPQNPDSFKFWILFDAPDGEGSWMDMLNKEIERKGYAIIDHTEFLANPTEIPQDGWIHNDQCYCDECNPAEETEEDEESRFKETLQYSDIINELEKKSEECTRILLNSVDVKKDIIDKYFDCPCGMMTKCSFPDLMKPASAEIDAEFEAAKNGEILIENPNELTNSDLKEVIELGISLNYLTSDTRGDRDNMILFLVDLDPETWEQLYLKWVKD
jgi:hypothetical protein